MAGSGSKGSCLRGWSPSSISAMPISPMTASSFRPGCRSPTGCAHSDVKPVEASFTHTLEPARPVTGIVTDKETGQTALPACSSRWFRSRMKNRYGGNVSVQATTDGSGRYRAAGRLGDFYWVSAYPEPGSGHIPVQKRQNRWPSGAKVLEVDLAVPRGRMVHGRVVRGRRDCPVSGASVVYQPGPGNPHNSGEYDFNSPVLTDTDGNFALTALAGAGLLVVEAPTPDFIRVALTGAHRKRSSQRSPPWVRMDRPAGR